MRAGPTPVVILATCPSGTATPRPSGPGTKSGSAARSRTRCARLGRQPHVDVARLARRVDPVAGVEAGKRHAQRLRHLADADADRARQPAIERDLELRLLAARRQAHVHRARHLRHLGLARCCASRFSSRLSGPCSCSWICFLFSKLPLPIDAVTPPSFTSCARRPASIAF